MRAGGGSLAVQALILCDGHDILKADLLFRHESEQDWRRAPLLPLGNDFYGATLPAEKLGTYFYTAEAAIDRYAGLARGLFQETRGGHGDGCRS